MIIPVPPRSYSVALPIPLLLRPPYSAVRSLPNFVLKWPSVFLGIRSGVHVCKPSLHGRIWFPHILCSLSDRNMWVISSCLVPRTASSSLPSHTNNLDKTKWLPALLLLYAQHFSVSSRIFMVSFCSTLEVNLLLRNCVATYYQHL